MRAHARNRRIASLHVSNDGVVIVRVKPPAIPDLPARLGIKRRVIKYDFAFFTSLQLLHAVPVMNYGQHFTTIRPRLPVSFEIRFRKLLISRIRRLLRRPFPGSASARLLLLHRMVEALLIEDYVQIAAHILYEILRDAKGIVKPESLIAAISEFLLARVWE